MVVLMVAGKVVLMVAWLVSATVALSAVWKDNAEAVMLVKMMAPKKGY